jgi:hypothetical protein
MISPLFPIVLDSRRTPRVERHRVALVVNGQERAHTFPWKGDAGLWMPPDSTWETGDVHLHPDDRLQITWEPCPLLHDGRFL